MRQFLDDAVKPASRLALGAVIGIVAALIAGIVWTPLTQTETAKACDSENRVCVTRTEAPGLILIAPKDELWISIDVDNCGTKYRTPFDLPDGELNVSFKPKYLELRNRGGDLARYTTTSSC